MREPITGVTTIVSNVYRISKDVYDLIGAIEDAPKHILAVAQDVRGLYGVLGTLQGLLEDLNPETLPENIAPMFDGLQESLNHCFWAFRELQMKICKFTKPTGNVRRSKWTAFRWQFTEKETNIYRAHLASYKSTVNVALAAASLANTSQTMQATHGLKRQMQMIGVQLEDLERTGAEGHCGSVDADDGSHITDREYALRRFLETAETVFSASRPGSPSPSTCRDGLSSSTESQPVATARRVYVLPSVFDGVRLGSSETYELLLGIFPIPFLLAIIICDLFNALVAIFESTPLLKRQGPPADIASPAAESWGRILTKIYNDGKRAYEYVHEVLFRRFSPKHLGFLGLFGVASSTLMIEFITAGQTSTSEKCGLWEFDGTQGETEVVRIDKLAKETRAAAYAQNCYGPPDQFDFMKCNMLSPSRLSFSAAQFTFDCPFQKEICTRNPTVTFATDAVDASELGLVRAGISKFRRRTSCTPLSMKYPFIQNSTQDGVTTYYYFYGDRPLYDPPLNYTYKTIGDPFNRIAPAAYTTSSTDTVGTYWNPRSELKHPPFSTLTLLFISSLRIFYSKWSDDPLFPADQAIYLSGEEKPWFRNSDPRARPLACVNYIEVCLGDGICWPMNDHLPRESFNNTISLPPEFWLMYASLLETDIFNAIEKRLGRGLIAQSKISQYFSEALGYRHWVDEVERLVATSHARTQINAWSIATGEDSVHEGEDGYKLVTPEKIYGNLCGLSKYQSLAHTSIHSVTFLAVLIILLVVFILDLQLLYGRGSGAEEDEFKSSGVQTAGENEGGAVNAEEGESMTRGDGTAGQCEVSSVPVSAISGQEGARATGLTASDTEASADA